MLKISLADERALVMGLSEALKTADVNLQGAVLYQLPEGYLDAELEQKLAKHLDRWGVVQFFRDRINRRLAASGLIPEPKNNDVRLVDIAEFSDTLEIAKEIVAELKTLPWSYTLYVRGPAGIYAGTARCPLVIEINDRFGLTSPHRLSRIKFRSGNDSLDDWLWRQSLGRKSRNISYEWIYFYYRLSGYIFRIHLITTRLMILKRRSEHFLVVASRQTRFTR